MAKAKQTASKFKKDPMLRGGSRAATKSPPAVESGQPKKRLKREWRPRIAYVKDLYKDKKISKHAAKLLHKMSGKYTVKRDTRSGFCTNHSGKVINCFKPHSKKIIVDSCKNCTFHWKNGKQYNTRPLYGKSYKVSRNIIPKLYKHAGLPKLLFTKTIKDPETKEVVVTDKGILKYYRHIFKPRSAKQIAALEKARNVRETKKKKKEKKKKTK